MKKLIVFMAMFAAALAANAATDTLTVRINGMKCEECGHKVLTVLRKVDGVGGVKFNYERRTAVIAYDNAKTCADTLRARLKATGRYASSAYDPTAVIRRGIGLRIDDMHCQKCADRIVARLQTIAGVDSMAPHLDKHYVFVRYDANRTSKDEIRAALGELGYTPVSYYTSKDIAYAYYLLPEGQATQETLENVLAIDAVDDVNVNAKNNALAITYFVKDMPAEKLLQEIHEAGVEASLPPAHECQEE